MAFEFIDLDAEIKPCQFVRNPYAVAKNGGSNEDSEHSEEEDGPAERKLRVSPIAKLACSMIPRINKLIKENSKGLAQ